MPIDTESDGLFQILGRYVYIVITKPGGYFNDGYPVRAASLAMGCKIGNELAEVGG